MPYIQSIAILIASKLDDLHADGRVLDLYYFYALLALTAGIHTTSENVHDAWAAWKMGHDSSHRSLVLFEHLSPEVQALDDKYRDAIIAVARTVNNLRTPNVVPTLAEIEKKYILQVLANCQGNRRNTAKTLKIGYNTLWRKLKLWRIPTAQKRGE